MIEEEFMKFQQQKLNNIIHLYWKIFYKMQINFIQRNFIVNLNILGTVRFTIGNFTITTVNGLFKVNFSWEKKVYFTLGIVKNL